MRRVPLVLGLAALVLAAAPAVAQLGAATRSPPPEGVAEGQSAGWPKGRYHELDALPDWGGIWFLQFGGGPASGPPPGPEPKGAYRERYEAWRAEVAANHGVVKRATSNCTPPGMPRFMQMAQYPYEFLFTPGRVTVNQEAWMQTRTIWTDGREHEDDPDPTFHGDSVGHWDGDTLVVDTIGINDTLEIAPGIGHSSGLRVTERIHLDPANPDVLINEMTYEDPDALAAPFHTTLRYGRDREGALIEFECAENDRNPVDEEGYTQAF